MSFTEGDPDSRHFLHVVPATETEEEREHLGIDTSGFVDRLDASHSGPLINGNHSSNLAKERKS